MRAVFESLGVSDIVCKSVGSGNYHAMVRATFLALLGMTTPRYVAAKLGKKLPEILSRGRRERRGFVDGSTKGEPS
jgi:small subunit ribosomal protein S5